MTPVSTNLAVYISIWVACAALLIHRHWHRGRGVGLVLSYVGSFGATHWLAPACYLLPWGAGSNLDNVLAGTFQSTLAMVLFSVGAEATTIAIDRRSPPKEDDGLSLVSPVVVNGYLLAGFLLHVVLFPIAQGIPSVSALVATGSTLFVVGVGLKCWNASHEGRRSAVWAWLASAAMLPFVTVATQGFLGYGMAAMMTVFAFVAAFHGPRWKLILAAVVLAYLGLSVYVTYMRDRADIREIVWSGSSLGERVGSVVGTIGQFEWFDVSNADHLNRIDDRLNQNYLIGAAVYELEAGKVPYARGATLVDALYSVIPRAVWPTKPMSAGSGDLVATYTGMKFAEGTSVGIGQVLEMYVNFGTAGVVIGFLILGALVSFIDRVAFDSLVNGEVSRFTMWFLAGLGLLQIGGSFVEAVSTSAAGLAMAFILSVIAKRFGVASEAADDDEGGDETEDPDEADDAGGRESGLLDR